MQRIKKILKWFLISIALLYLTLIIIAYLPYKTIPVEQLAEKESKFVKVNGHNIHYTKQGQGKPLILSHGFAGSIYTWRDLIPLLTEHYTVYAYDILAFGLSDKPADGNYDMKSHGDMIIDFMDALQLPSATLVGHSMGGVIIGYTAIAAPSRVDSLVMIEPGFYNKAGPAFLKYLFFPLDRLMTRQFYTRGMRRTLLEGSFYNKSLITEEMIDAYMATTKTPGAIEAMTHMMKTVGIKQYPGVTEKITRPTLLVWGKRGPAPLAEPAGLINQEIKGSILAIVEESGHYIQEEQPKKLAEIIKDFVG